MDDTGLPQISDELPELSELSTQDIPEAVREGTGTPNQAPKRKSWLWGIGGLGAAALVAILLMVVFRLQPTSDPVSNSSTETEAAVSDAEAPTQSNPSAAPNSEETSLLGHLPYEEAAAADLLPALPGSSVMLHRSAAKKFEEMADAAAADGVLLVPLSGFRSVTEQESLFFGVKAERGEVAAKRATVSAPPGYSEHHTGYAIDIGDGDRPSADLQVSFEETRAFKWLQENAAYYSFELSFPKGNSDQVSYEPWHWRFVGDRRSLETFYRARTQGGGKEEAASPETQSTSNQNLEPQRNSGTAKPEAIKPETSKPTQPQN